MNRKLGGLARRGAARKGKPAASNGPDVLSHRGREVTEIRILDRDLIRILIEERQKLGIDQHDEVWDGVYVVPPLANNPHQRLTGGLYGIFQHVIGLEGRGDVLPGANVSDRRTGWKQSFRAPDVVVVLPGSRAVDCTTHWFGGPDFLVEVESPGDETQEKIPFYNRLQVRELLIIQRDTRLLKLYRHDGMDLVEVSASNFEGGKWLVSAVVPLAFRRRTTRTGPQTEVRRTDGQAGSWIV